MNQKIVLNIGTPAAAENSARFVAELARQGIAFRAVADVATLEVTLTGGF